MKIIAAFALIMLLGSAMAAQDLPGNPIPKGTVELGLFGGGGMGLGKSDGTQFFFAGGRAGWVLTSDHLSGLLRGNFEWAVDVMPVYVVFPPESAVYGGCIRPLIWKWNFTSGKKIVPSSQRKAASFSVETIFRREILPRSISRRELHWSARISETEASVVF